MPNRQHCVQFWKLPTQALNHSTLKLLSTHCYKCFVGFRRIRLILQSSMWRKVSSNRGKWSKISSHRAERKRHRLNFRTVYTPRQFSVAACCINCLPRVCQTVVAPGAWQNLFVPNFGNRKQDLNHSTLLCSEREDLHLHLVLAALPRLPHQHRHHLPHRHRLQSLHQGLCTATQIQVQHF